MMLQHCSFFEHKSNTSDAYQYFNVMSCLADVKDVLCQTLMLKKG